LHARPRPPCSQLFTSYFRRLHDETDQARSRNELGIRALPEPTQLFHDADQIVEIEGLRQVCIGSGLEGMSVHVDRVARARHDDNHVVERRVCSNSSIDTFVSLPKQCVAPIIIVMAGSEDFWFAVTGVESE